MSLEFQIYDWMEDHEKDEDSDSEDTSDKKNEIGTYIIHTFGRMMDGRSVYMRIINFTPHFYIKLPLNWSKVEAKNNVSIMYRYFTSDINKKVWAKYRPCLLSMDVVERKTAEGFTNEKQFLFARLIFNNLIAMNKFRFVFEESAIYIPGVTTKPTNFKTFEANLLPMLRCFHIKKISGCSWVEVSEYTKISIESEKESYCDIEIRVDWRKINPIVKSQNAPLRIMSFDIECFSSDGSFPQSRRSSDHITMIGSTYTYLGESTPYRQHIVCLKKTNDLDNIIVESYDDERDVIGGWIKEIKRSDCDIITGYNIFFFDEAYIYERCSEQLNIMHEINKISKLKNYECNFRDFKLASSALGENRIRMFNTPGRIHIDLMKDVQKNHKLSCYKLDFVASSFIRDMITSMRVENNSVILKCSGINDIMVGDFIHIEHALDFISDMIGNKYMITHINKDEKLLTVESNDIENLIEFINTPEYIEWIEASKEDRKFKLWWCQAKDDIDVKQIFKSFKGSPDDRAIVAKYCIKDCKLVNLLMDKLNIVTNNIEMSNVCYVPMSFLFTRGQTIKLFSLCLKEFRENGYLFPVLKKPDIKLPSFEGAVVFPPEETIEYEALPVNDFASLYPSVDIELNASPETKIKNEVYDNIPGVKYHNAKFRDHDGTIQYRRFAEKEKKGVVPTILSNLLKERAVVKKQMKTETNYFTAKILDGKQLALKVTANSLYGALGADTSPVYDRDIAACITSVGRERLELAKNFVENIVPGFFNGLKYAWMDGREETAKILIEMEVKKQDDKLIERLRRCVTKDLSKIVFQPIVRYGDSVIGKTPLLLRNIKTGMILLDSIENLASNDMYNIMERENNDQMKEYCNIDMFESWTEMGWTKIERVIRHKLDPSKKLFRITTHSGSVVATDDHSLLTNKGETISPKKMVIGDKLLHSFPEINNNIVYTFYNGVVLNTEISQFLGMFMGDGSCGIYNYKSGDKASFALNNLNKEVIHKYQDIGNKYFTDFVWNVLDTVKSSGVYKLCPINKKTLENKTYGNIKTFVSEMRDLMYTNDKQKKVPDFILNASRDIREAFFIGLYDADGYKTNRGQICNDMYDKNLSKVDNNKVRCGTQIDQKGMVSSLGIYTLGKSLGYNVSINNRRDKKNIYRIRFSTDKLRKDPDMIKKIEEWDDMEEYVYDLTTTNHHFQAGVGSMIVHNTDSIFTCYRFRESTKRIKDDDSMKLWKEVVKFSEKLLSQFIPFEHRDMWETSHQKYYRTELITDLMLPPGPSYVDPPSHYKTLQPVEERMEQFLLRYMEEGYLSWLWSLQDIFTKKYIDDRVRDNMIEAKLFNIGCSLVERMRLVPEEMTDELKGSIGHMVKNFIDKKLKEYILEPYWDIMNGIKITRIHVYKNGIKIIDKRCLVHSIEMGILAGEFIKNRLPFPHDCKYEKTFWPFLILTKKRYVGNKYEEDPDKYKQDYNGIVLKRRDNAPIVKEICGGIINYLINEKDPKKAKEFTIECMRKMFNNMYNIKYFLTSKTLKMKESYSDWTKIAHVVLADRIAIRSPGTAPQSGDRIEFAAVVIPNMKKTTLQGERIETPEYIEENNLKLDYEYYMVNQIMNPSLQFLSLVIPNAERIFDEFKIKIENDKQGRTNILDYCKR